MSLFPLCPAHRLLARPPEEHWLIEGLFAEEGVGIVGGEPKCCKSFLALDMAVSVASGTPCLGRFAVRKKGPVLLYAAEDALHVVRERLAGICEAAHVEFEQLDVQVITARTLRLDVPADRERLADTVAAVRPRLLVLDPFVRLHRIDENASGEVAPILAFLRDVQRACHVGVAVVHHAKKGAGSARAGQALRGSSEFHAWGDSNLYLRRDGERLTLCVEHRSAASIAPIDVSLTARGKGLALRVNERPPAEAPARGRPPRDVIESVLRASGVPLPYAVLREACGMRNSTLWTTLNELVTERRVEKSPRGYALAAA